MSARVPFALGSFALSAVLSAIGTFSGSDDHELRNWLVVLVIAAVATAIVFWVVVPRIDNLSRGSLILAIIGAITIVVFWLGIPVVITAGAALLALEARKRGVGASLATARSQSLRLPWSPLPRSLSSVSVGFLPRPSSTKPTPPLYSSSIASTRRPSASTESSSRTSLIISSAV